MTWTTKIEQDEEGNLIVPVPDELLVQLGVGIGDSLYLTEEPPITKLLDGTPYPYRDLSPRRYNKRRKQG